MIEKLTPEQEELLKVYHQKWTAIGRSTVQYSREQMEEAIRLVYQCGGVPPPARFEHFDDVKQGDKRARELSSEFCTVYGQHEAGWLGSYDFFRAIGVTGIEKLEGLFLAAERCGWFWPFDEVCIITPKTSELHLDENNQLHNPDGPAVAYPSGWGVYAIHGVRVPKQVIMEPDTLTIEQINGERNAEVRRIMMTRFGLDRYTAEGKAKLLNQDEYGKLWRTEVPNDEPLVMLEVINSTPEPEVPFEDTYQITIKQGKAPVLSFKREDGEMDFKEYKDKGALMRDLNALLPGVKTVEEGSKIKIVLGPRFKNYWLRVPPEISTAHEAVAWSFNKPVTNYAPRIET